MLAFRDGGIVQHNRETPLINLGRNHLESWDDIQYVLAVARTGSFVVAGEKLGTNQSTVSRHVQRIERRLGVKLFDRYSHGMRLTPSGAGLIEKARGMEAAAHEIERHLAGVDQKMTGSVCIAVSDGFASYWLIPAMLEFQQRHPQLYLEIIAGTGQIDLLAREADIAIRLFVPKQDRVVAVKVGRVRFSLFAERRYIERFGKPDSIEELRTHRIVDHLGYAPLTSLRRWHEFVAEHSNVVCRADTTSSFVAAIRAGYGIGLLPNFYDFAEPEFTRIDVKFDAESPLWLLSHEETNRNARIQAVADFLIQRFRQDRRKWFS